MKVVTDHLSLLQRHGDQISEYDSHGGGTLRYISVSNSKPSVLRLKQEQQTFNALQELFKQVFSQV